MTQKMKDFERIMFVLRGKKPTADTARLLTGNPFPSKRLIFETVDSTITMVWHAGKYGFYEKLACEIRFNFRGTPEKFWKIYPDESLGFFDRQRLKSFTHRHWQELVDEEKRKRIARTIPRDTIPLRERPDLTPDEIAELFLYEQPDDWIANVSLERVEGSM